ncbi:hypothetical protein [Streptomyces sp. NPDC051452]|uniref:hypothetical protein n=1 Tax=Streptomyces sp. NPDC051452 TaxID=3365654 RepID=UPI0037A93E77
MKLANCGEPRRGRSVTGSMFRRLLDTTVVTGRWYEPDHGAPSSSRRGTVDLSSAAKAREWFRRRA